MLLLEIFDSLKQQTADEYFKSIVLSYKDKLKKGSFAIVIDDPQLDYVYRIWDNDPAYDTWIKYVMANQDQNTIPKILSNKVNNIRLQFSDENLTVKVIKLERLQEKETPKIFYKQSKVKDIQFKYLDDFLNFVMTSFVDYKSYNKAIKLSEENKYDLEYDVDDLIWSLFSIGNQFKLDIKDSNIMWRNNTPVLTDPIADLTIKQIDTLAHRIKLE